MNIAVSMGGEDGPASRDFMHHPRGLYSGSRRRRQVQWMKIRLEPAVAAGGQPIRGVVAGEQALVEKLGSTCEALRAGDQFIPSPGDRLVVGLGVPGTRQHRAESGDQPAQTILMAIALGKTSGDPDVPLVGKLRPADEALLEGGNEVVIFHPIRIIRYRTTCCLRLNEPRI
jgi:hypothetical protein